MTKGEGGITDFGRWVLEQMESVGIVSQHELARRGNISQSSISNVISGKRGIEIETAIGIARGLKCDPIEVLRQAGVLPREVGRDELLDRLARIVASWPIEERERFLRLAQAQDFLLSQPGATATTAGRIADEKTGYGLLKRGKKQ